MGMRAVIVDDEGLARARMERLLRMEDDVEVVGVFSDGIAASDGLARLDADVVFLDIRMPQVDGFDVLEGLPSANRPLVVYVTAYSEHAVRAFDTHAIDYLVKPVATPRLRESLQRVSDELVARQARSAAPRDDPMGFPERLVVPDGPRMRLVPVDELECVLAQGNYVELRLCDGRSLLLRGTLGSVQAQLDPRSFLRIHRSRIVRVDAVEQLDTRASGQYQVKMRSGLRMTSGRLYREQLRRALGLPLASCPT